MSLDKNLILKIARLKNINNQINMSDCLTLISEFTDEKDKSKTPQVLQIFPQLPSQIQIKLIDICLDHYIHKFNINTISKVYSTPFGEQFDPIWYY